VWLKPTQNVSIAQNKSVAQIARLKSVACGGKADIFLAVATKKTPAKIPFRHSFKTSPRNKNINLFV
jgi:hypothetical protein